MSAPPMARSRPAPSLRRRSPSITLAAALLLIVLFGGTLLAVNQHGDRASGVIPAGVPAASATPAPSVTPTPASDTAALPETVRLDGIRYEAQGWNNQGPANLAMALSYWGWEGDQFDLAVWLKPHPEDKSVAPWQIAYYTNTFTGYRAIYRMGGTSTLLKRLLAAGFPVIVRQSIQPWGDDWMGHYVLLMGYDEEEQDFLTYDSFLGSNLGNGRPSPYSIFDERWRHFNRTFIVVYDPAREDELRNALGDYADPVYGAEHALEVALVDSIQDRDDAWSWFNLGTSYVALGQRDNAAIAYDQAINLGLPWRTLWYQFGPYEAYFWIGDYDNVLALANTTLATTPYVEETYYWQALVYRAQRSMSAMGTAFDNLLRYNPNFLVAWVDQFQGAAGSEHLPVGWEADAGVLLRGYGGPPEPTRSPANAPAPTAPPPTISPPD